MDLDVIERAREIRAAAHSHSASPRLGPNAGRPRRAQARGSHGPGRATFITSAWQGEDIQRTVGNAAMTTTEGDNHSVKKHRKSARFAMND